MRTAADAMDEEVRALENEAEELIREMRRTVGGLSDLRYGKFADAQLVEHVMNGLEALGRDCEES